MTRTRKATRDPALEEILLAGLAEGITLRKLCRRHQIAPALVQRWRLEDRICPPLCPGARGRVRGDCRKPWKSPMMRGRCDLKEKADGTMSVAKNPDNVARRGCGWRRD
jgi:hypothetical protein